MKAEIVIVVAVTEKRTEGDEMHTALRSDNG